MKRFNTGFSKALWLFKLTLLFVPGIITAQKKAVRITTAHLTSNFYICTSYGMPDGKTLFPANNLYVVTRQGVILIDTPWSEDQMKQLADAIAKKHHQKIVLCIVSHYHDDRTAGLNWLKSSGVKTYSSKLTQTLCVANKNMQAAYTFTHDTTFKVGNVALQTYYPGPGHTQDNLMVWFPESKVLYGGCLVRSLASYSIPQTAGAVPAAWPSSIQKVMAKYSKAIYVVPGHQSWAGGRAQLTHTLTLLKK